MAGQTQANFQPQVRDTSNGPNLHTYVPRSDGAIMVGSVAYYPSGHAAANATAAATTIPAVVQPGQPAGFAPTYVGQPGIQQPIHYPNVPVVVQPQPVHQQPYQYMTPGVAYPHIQQPPFGTVGLTAGEVLAQQMNTARGLGMDQAQEMKPADDDKFRFYWVRELDGQWSHRNRLTIDSGDIGECRWYAIDGIFYAVRLPSS